MTILALVFLGLAAAIHVFIFWLESVVWTTPRARKVFDTTPESAASTRQLAYNQGFYNLFLAIGAVASVVATASGFRPVALALACASAGSMVAAALVLAASDRTKLRPALIQGVPPAVGLLALLLAG